MALPLLADPLLADSVGPGGTAFLIVLGLIVVTIGIFFAMVGSLKRLRRRVADGEFGQPREAERHESTTNTMASPKASPKANTGDAVTPDRGSRGGEGV